MLPNVINFHYWDIFPTMQTIMVGGMVIESGKRGKGWASNGLFRCMNVFLDILCKY